VELSDSFDRFSDVWGGFIGLLYFVGNHSHEAYCQKKEIRFMAQFAELKYIVARQIVSCFSDYFTRPLFLSA
jgi:hypothetical protein